MIELEKIDAANVAQIGIGDASLQSKTRATKLGLSSFDVWAVLDRGIKDVAKEAAEIATNGTDHVYVTVDVDILDAAYAPATEIPTIQGLTSRQLIEAIRIVAQAGADGFDICEVGGHQQDPNIITARAAATVTAEFIASTPRKRKVRG